MPDAIQHAYSFADLQRAADACREVAIGIRRLGLGGKSGGGVQLNPWRDERLQSNQNDEIIVATTWW